MPRRWSRPLQSVRVRITLAAVLVTAVAVGAAGWLIVTSFEDAQVREVRGNAEAYLDRIVARLEQGQDPQEAVTAAVGTLRPPGPATVTDEDGRVVATSSPGSVEGEDEGEDDGEVGAEEGTGQDDRSPSGDEVVAAPVESLTRVVANPGGDLMVTVMAPVDEVARNVEFLTRRLAIGLPALVLVVGVIAWMLVGRALRPVEAIRAEVEGITGSTIHRRVPEPSTSDEVGRLARTMNTMLGRLETAAVRQRRFVSDASHELRSPVAIIRAGLEVARDRTDPATWPALVDSLLAEESRLEALLDDLLLLATYDENGTSPAPTRPVDLTALTLAEGRRCWWRERRTSWPGRSATWSTTPPVTPLRSSRSASATTGPRPTWSSTTTAPASPRRTASGSSNGSPASTTAAPATRAAPAWASPWSTR